MIRSTLISFLTNNPQLWMKHLKSSKIFPKILEISAINSVIPVLCTLNLCQSKWWVLKQINLYSYQWLIPFSYSVLSWWRYSCPRSEEGAEWEGRSSEGAAPGGSGCDWFPPENIRCKGTQYQGSTERWKNYSLLLTAFQ